MVKHYIITVLSVHLTKRRIILNYIFSYCLIRRFWLHCVESPCDRVYVTYLGIR